jgi:hypothetical protein
MEPKSLLPYSQEPVIGLYPEPDEPSPHPSHIEPRLLYETNICSASQDILHFYGTKRFITMFIRPWELVLHFFKIHFNIIL